MNSSSLKCGDKRTSSSLLVWLSAASGLFVVVFMVMFVNDTEILIQSEDRASEQERLRHIVEQPTCHVVDVDHLVSHHHDAAHDEQHRAGILRDFKAFLFFHGFDVLHRARSRSASLNVQCSMVNVQ